VKSGVGSAATGRLANCEDMNVCQIVAGQVPPNPPLFGPRRPGSALRLSVVVAL